AARSLEAMEQKLKSARRELSRATERQRKRMVRGEKQADTAGLPAVVAGAMKRQAEVTLGKTLGTHQERVTRARTDVTRASERVKIVRTIPIDWADVAVPASRHLLELRNVNLVLDPRHGPIWSRPLDLSVHGPARVAITGANGSGKTSLLKLIAQT